MQHKFKDIELEFLKLKNSYRQRKISEREFKDKLKKLRLNDKSGRCWTIGARTGKWYFFNGKKWIESKPPTLQEGKAICIYCGFENELENQECGYCGGNLESRGPDAGTSRGGNIGAQSSNKFFDSGFEPTSKESLDWESFDLLPSKDEVSEEIFLGEDYNAILRSLSPGSLFLFMGILGFMFGFVFGVFVGASNFFLIIVRNLPVVLQSIHGKLVGGIIFGVLGGLCGFFLLGIIGFLQVLLINVILSFFGGIKVRLDRFSS